MRIGMLPTLFLCVGSAMAFGQTSSSTADQQPSAVTVTPAQPQAADTTTPPKKKKHIYTSEEFKAADPNDTPSPGASGDSTGANSAAGAAGDTAKADKSTTAKKSKKPDQAAIDKQQAKVDDLKQQVNGETNVIASLQKQIADVPSRADAMGPGLAKQQSDLVKMQKDLADEQSKLDAMKNPPAPK